jgi:hypothetical protein
MNEAKQLQLRGGDGELSRVPRSRRRPKRDRVAEQTWLETGSLASQSNQDSSGQLCLQESKVTRICRRAAAPHLHARTK